MIRRIVLKNFQRHKHLTIDFDQNVTCLIGPTDAGKSAVIRALYWCCLNKPGGDDFLKHGEKEVSVRLYTKQHKIDRIRSKRTNEYRINDRTLKAFGQANVPIEVGQAIQVDEDNFRLQLDPHFWFSDSAGQVSQKLNEVVNLSQIDTALEYAATSVKEARNEVSFSNDRLAAAVVRLESLHWVPRFLRRAEVAQRLEKEYNAKLRKIAVLEKLISAGRSHVRRRDRAKESVLRIEAALVVGQRAIAAQKKYDTVRDLVGRGRRAVKLTKLDLTKFDRLHELRIKGDAFAEKVRIVEMLVDEGTRLEEEICRLNESIVQLEKEKSSMSRICETCGQPILSTSSASPPLTYTCATRRHAAGPRKVRPGTA